MSPNISSFEGINIFMQWNDHTPPHFHAVYGEFEAIIDIKNCAVLAGILPKSKLKLVLAWCVLHREELLVNWELAMEGKPLQRINPLRR